MYFILVLIFIIGPLGVIVHELGHTIAALFLKANSITFSIGTGRKIFSFSQKKLSVSVNALFFLGGYSKSNRVMAYKRWEKLFITLAGPIANGLLAFLLYKAQLPFHPFIKMFILFNYWLCFINLIPYKVGSKCSDGYMCVKLFSKRREAN